jgi:hypothetical protein
MSGSPGAYRLETARLVQFTLRSYYFAFDIALGFWLWSGGVNASVVSLAESSIKESVSQPIHEPVPNRIVHGPGLP